MSPIEVLLYALEHVYHADKSNAAMHCAPARFSPITFRLAECLSVMRPEHPTVAEVMSHRGQYAEDPGR